MERRFDRFFPDMEELHRGFREQPCSLCRMVAGDVRFPENVIQEDRETLVFLDRYPRAYGYTLVAPKEHREQVTADFAPEEYLRLQALVYRASEAVRGGVGAELMYLYTLGSNQENAHAHWHVVPLPPGVPYEDQQGVWVDWDRGVPEISRQEMSGLAGRIRRRL